MEVFPKLGFFHFLLSHLFITVACLISALYQLVFGLITTVILVAGAFLYAYPKLAGHLYYMNQQAPQRSLFHFFLSPVFYDSRMSNHLLN